MHVRDDDLRDGLTGNRLLHLGHQITNPGLRRLDQYHVILELDSHDLIATADHVDAVRKLARSCRGRGSSTATSALTATATTSPALRICTTTTRSGLSAATG